MIGADAAKLATPGDATRLIMALEGAAPGMTPEQRDALMLLTLPSALDEITAKLGADTGAWKWGALHKSRFAHPLQDVVAPEVHERFTVSGWPLGGSGVTPLATTYRTSDFSLTSGASFRMVVDAGNWDDSRAVNAPGQSGDPSNPHYRDLVPLWGDGKYFPLLYSRGAVERATESRLRLVAVNAAAAPQ